jgi:hypothetical protein
MESYLRLYSESLFVARGLENWNWELRSCRRIVVEEGETMGIQQHTKEYNRENGQS